MKDRKENTTMLNKIRLQTGQRTANILNVLKANNDEWLTSAQITELVKVKDASGQLTLMSKKGLVTRKKDANNHWVYKFSSSEPTVTSQYSRQGNGNGSISRSDILLGGVDQVLFKAATDYAEYKNALKKIRAVLNALELD
jgi:hypothetical protein